MRDSPDEIDIDDDFFEENLSILGQLKHDDLGIDPAMENYNNQRKTIRYIRGDISASINRSDFFGGYNLFSYSNPIKVKLLDISSKGALIFSPKKINLNKNINLVLTFNCNKKFEIPSKVVREETYAQKIYGLKFNNARHDLGDYLLETQTKLVFQDF
jgi:hypothetical protein